MKSEIKCASPPDLSDPSRWFDYYDRDGSGSLDKEEVVSGLLHTLHSCGGSQSTESVRDTVYAVWSAFDLDGSGTIDRQEFCAPSGMAEGLLAATAQDQQAYVPGSATAPSAPPPSSGLWECAKCTFINKAQEGTCKACGGQAPLQARVAPSQPTKSHDRGFPSYPGTKSRPSQQVYVPHAQPYVPGSAPAPSAPPSSSDYWECAKCTFINKARDGACKACGGKQPAGAEVVPSRPTHHAPPQQMHCPAQQTLHQPPTTQQQQQQKQQMTTKCKTVRVQIPPGMGPGQMLRVLTDSSGTESVDVTIPDKQQWKTQTPHGQPFFDIQVPEKQKETAPVLVTGAYVSGSGGQPAAHCRPSTNVHSSVATVTRPSGPLTPWQAWEQFTGHEFKPVPIGMQNVPVSPVSSLSSIHVSGRRRALLIGINYRGTRAALRGCVNDANNMEQLLARHGFPTDSRHMVKLVDEGARGRNYMPTRTNILNACQWLVQGASEGDVLFFHFSGHGAQVPDKTGHEADGYNETICPMDYKTGQITDDTLWGSLVYPLPAGVRLTAVMDCCHSGTGLDLPYECNIKTGQWKEEVNPAHAKADAILFSGCEDSQTSADAYDKYQAGGAMTQSFIRAYQDNPMALYPDFMAAIHRHLKKRGFHQRPQLTASQKFDVKSRVFSFVDGIEPNHNRQVGRMKRRHIHPARVGYQNSNMNDLLFGAGGAIALAGLASLFLD